MCAAGAAAVVLAAALASARAPAPTAPRGTGKGQARNAPEAACSWTVLGRDLDAPQHDLQQQITPTLDACGQACCANPRCAGALFEPESAVTYGGCKAAQPCCFLKTSVADHAPMGKPPAGGATLFLIPGRSQDDEKLNFLSATLGSHMVLQQAPQRAVVWGHTAPGATVTTVMRKASSGVTQTLTAVAAADGTWRQPLPPTTASKTPYAFNFSSSSAAAVTASMSDVLFGEVYLCGGQSNMEFAMPAVANASAERQAANDFPTIRFFSVGHRTASNTPLRDLQTVWEPWQVASNVSIAKDFSPGHTLFSTFSAVCWLFGKELSAALSPTGDVPIGLVSDNWGGTKIEEWVPATAFAPCNRSGPSGPMYNAMILPYAEGPMALAGFVWYQGEANTANATTAQQYAALFPQMIVAWRAAFKAPDALFLFVQLSTWCALPPESLPQMREAQMAALSLPHVGYATNADHGMGCNIHPAAKQHVGRRLANAARALQYNASVPWRSPSYSSAVVSGGADGSGHAQRRTVESGVASVTVTLLDVGASGLHTVHPFNYESPGYGPAATQVPTVVNCTGTFPSGPATNTSMLTQCGWAALEVAGAGWLNATVAVHPDKQRVVLSAALPPSLGSMGAPTVLASAYGWAPIPMLSVYDTTSGLPVLPWNRSL